MATLVCGRKSPKIDFKESANIHIVCMHKKGYDLSPQIEKNIRFPTNIALVIQHLRHLCALCCHCACKSGFSSLCTKKKKKISYYLFRRGFSRLIILISNKISGIFRKNTTLILSLRKQICLCEKFQINSLRFKKKFTYGTCPLSFLFFLCSAYLFRQ